MELKSLWVLVGLLLLSSIGWAAEPALDEVNALRKAKGLKPYLIDSGLQLGAEKCADYRAAHLIEGHTRNDFRFLPLKVEAEAAGAGAAVPKAGWLSCCVYEDWDYAGAAYKVGKNGKRYMTIFVR